MLVCDFSGIRIHATSGLARLDVAPDHGCHVALVVHETGVEVGSLIRIRRDDVGAAAREGIFQEMEHAEEFARRHEHVISKEIRGHMSA